jgi:hypothetical protein
MTSRRSTLIEQGACELLQRHGYAVEIAPPGYPRKYPPVHLIATRPPCETRLIRIQKLSRVAASVEIVERKCRIAITFFRKHIARDTGTAPVRYEIWTYSLSYGFRCFVILPDCVREIPRFPEEALTFKRYSGVV